MKEKRKLHLWDTKTNPDFDKRIADLREEIAIGSAQADSGCSLTAKKCSLRFAAVVTK